MGWIKDIYDIIKESLSEIKKRRDFTRPEIHPATEKDIEKYVVKPFENKITDKGFTKTIERPGHWVAIFRIRMQFLLRYSNDIKIEHPRQKWVNTYNVDLIVHNSKRKINKKYIGIKLEYVRDPLEIDKSVFEDLYQESHSKFKKKYDGDVFIFPFDNITSTLFLAQEADQQFRNEMVRLFGPEKPRPTKILGAVD